MIQTILVPLDGSHFSEHALGLSCELARALAARIVLVCVAGPGLALSQNLTDQDRQEIASQYAGIREEEHLLSFDPHRIERTQQQVRAIAEAERYLASIVERLTKEGLEIDAGIPYGEAAAGILTEIELRSADLVVMAAHARTGLGHLVVHSVSQAVVAGSPVPVLLIPPEDK